VPTLAASALREGLALRATSPPLEPRRLFIAVPERPYRTPQADAMVDLLVDAGAMWPAWPWVPAEAEPAVTG
jgi:DNA-binding transcriptional LysR family regulator